MERSEVRMRERILSVPEVTCDHCISAIEGAVGKVAGVERVKVDLETKQVSVAFDEARTGLAEIVRTIENEGYDVPGESV